MQQSSSVGLCRSVISVLVATALYSPMISASTVDYGETVDGVVLVNDIQTVYGTTNNTKITATGEQHVKKYGVSNNTEINGGYQHIESEGEVNNSTLNDGYQIVQVEGAANQTTINNGVLQVYGAANEAVIKGGSLIVENGGIAVFAVIEKGGLLEIKDQGYAIAVNQKAGSAIKATTRAAEVEGVNSLGQFSIKDGVANNVLLENGGSLLVEENDFAYDTTVDNGGVLKVMDGGTAIGIDKKAGGVLTISTNVLEVSGKNSKGEFSIKNGESINYELDNGSMLIVQPQTKASYTIVDEYASMQNLGSDTGTTVMKYAVYNLGRADIDGQTQYSYDASSEGMKILGGQVNVWAGTMSNVTVSDAAGVLQIMTPLDNSAAPVLTGTTNVLNRASLYVHESADTINATVNLDYSNLVLFSASQISAYTQFMFSELNMRNSDVIMRDDFFSRTGVASGTEHYINLAVNTLAGSGNFYMRTDMANHQSDQLNVTGQATGDFKIFVTDTGASPAAGDSLTLVTTGGGDAVFTLGNNGGVVDIGTYEYTLLDNGNHSWSLAENRAQVTPSTTAVLNMAAAQPLVFDAELDTVRERLGSIKGINYDTAMWSSAINTRNNVTTDAGAAFEQTLTGLTLGIDSRFSREESSTIRGLFFGYSHSDVGFDRGGKGNIDSYTLGAYAGWEHQNGAYIDGVVKVDRFANTVHGKMSNGATAFGDYDSDGAGAHIEGGFRWGEDQWNIRPYLAFTGFTTDGQDYTLSNGMRADVGNTRILRAEAGTAVSYHMNLQNSIALEPWLKAAVRQEYADSNQVKVNDDGKFDNDVAGTHGVYQAGIRSSFTPTLSGHLSVSYGNGAGVESPWNTQAGVVWTF